MARIIHPLDFINIIPPPIAVPPTAPPSNVLPPPPPSPTLGDLLPWVQGFGGTIGDAYRDTYNQLKTAIEQWLSGASPELYGSQARQLFDILKGAYPDLPLPPIDFPALPFPPAATPVPAPIVPLQPGTYTNTAPTGRVPRPGSAFALYRSPSVTPVTPPVTPPTFATPDTSASLLPPILPVSTKVGVPFIGEEPYISAATGKPVRRLGG